jgi:hypothetical protein
MATEGPLLHDGGQCVAAADLSATTNQFLAVYHTTTARNVNIQTTSGAAIAGILQNTPASGQAADIGFCGISKALVGSAGFAAGDQLMVDGTGKLVTKTSTNVVVGVALEAGVTGQIATVYLIPTGG